MAIQNKQLTIKVSPEKNQVWQGEFSTPYENSFPKCNHIKCHCFCCPQEDVFAPSPMFPVNLLNVK